MFRLALNGLRLWPHLMLAASRPDNDAVWADVDRWRSIVFGADAPRSRMVSLLRLLSFHPEFRNLFYYRTGLAGRLLRPLCGPLPTLYITTPEIGPGLYIQHGFATIISAKRIGRDCWINQQVTIGYRNDTDAPTLGDRVTVNAGAKIIGQVHVGDDAKVGANAVVVKDVPARTTVVGVPARVVRRDGVRIDAPL
jgi:serine O-acetyltransferase